MATYNVNPSDSMSISDRIFYRIKNLSEILGITSGKISNSLSRFNFDYIDFDDNLQRVHNLTGIDTVSLADLLNKLLKKYGLDGMDLEDDTTRSLTINKVDDILLVDGPSKTLPKYDADDLNISDELSESLSRQISDGVVLEDDTTRLLSRYNLDNINIDDSVIGVGYLKRLLLSDSVLLRTRLFRQNDVKQYLSLADNDYPSKLLQKIDADDLNISDDLSESLSRYISDNFSIEDRASKLLSRYMSDSIIISDSLVSVGYLQRLFLSDSMLLSTRLFRQHDVKQFLSLLDSFRRGFARYISASESMLLPDSLVYLFTKNLSEVLEIVDAIAYCNNYVFGIIQRINAADNIGVVDSFLPKSIKINKAEAIDISDFIRSLCTHSPLIRRIVAGDNLALSDALKKLMPKRASDNISILGKIKNFILRKTTNDHIPIPDILSKIIRLTYSDTDVITDNIIQGWVKNVLFSDLVNISDIKTKSFIKNVVSVLSVSSAITQKQTRKSLADNLVVDDELYRIIRSLQSDSIVINDSMIRSRILSILSNDSLVISDSNKLILLRILAEDLSLSDILTQKQIGISLSDNLDVDDEHTVIKNIFKFPSDSLLLSEESEKSWFGFPSDSQSISDSVIKNIQLHKNDSLTLWDRICYEISSIGWNIGTESLLLLDKVAKTVGIYKFESIDIYEALRKFIDKRPTDNISLSDSIIKHFSRLNDDQLVILDNLSRLLSMHGLFDNVGMVDRFNRLKPLFANDSMPISDSLIALWAKNLNDIIVPQDNFVKRVFKTAVEAPVALYEALKKQVHKLFNSDEEIVDSMNKDYFEAPPTPKSRKEPVPKEPVEEEWHDITSIQRKGPK